MTSAAGGKPDDLHHNVQLYHAMQGNAVIQSMAELYSMSHVGHRLLLHSWPMLRAVSARLAPLGTIQDIAKCKGTLSNRIYITILLQWSCQGLVLRSIPSILAACLTAGAAHQLPFISAAVTRAAKGADHYPSHFCSMRHRLAPVSLGKI